LREATDVFIHLVSSVGTEEGSGKEPNSKPKIGESSRPGFETVDSAEDLFREEIQIRWIALFVAKGGEGSLPAKVANIK